MSLTSLAFLCFTGIAVLGYYLIPKKWQWIWLLLFSYIYYLSGGIRLIVFLLFSTFTTYLAGILMENPKQEGMDSQKIKKINRKIVILTLLLNFGMLAVLKYRDFAAVNLNRVFQTKLSFSTVMLPLGISFYTFQSMGYLLDVYWRKCEAEKNPFRFALFVSFFPQILQGPIGRYSRLGKQLFESHTFDWKRLEHSVWLILWGFFKKMVLADNAALFVDYIFGNYEQLSGVAVIAGVLGYSIQLYGDFSGGMDVVMGIAELFGISLDQNFKRPYFSVSITDFWHRWHITLGTWMKDYVFYPGSLSGWMGKFKKITKKIFGKKIGRTLPICVANVLVFLIVGVWHGAAWKYIVYGLYNGLIIGISGLFMPEFRLWKEKLRINDKSALWHVFTIVRTFLLVNISWYFDRGANVKEAFTMMKLSITRFSLPDLWNGSLLFSEVSNVKIRYLILLFGCILLFLYSLYEERKGSVFQTMQGQKPVVRVILCLLLLFMIPLLGQTPMSGGGFIYAQF